MYLQVTTVAEITDHTGNSLLLQALLQHPAHAPHGLHDISTSTLTWPCVHCPAKASWKLWTTTMCNLFTGSVSNLRLNISLGEWTLNYMQYRRWHWRLAPTGRLLHQSPSMCNPQAAIQMRAQRTQLMFSPTIPTNQLFDGPPVTPVSTDHRIVKLPVPTLPNHLPAPPPRRFHRSFIEQFRTTLSPWQRPLFGPIQQLQPMARLRDISQNIFPLLLVSDASVQKNKQSSFAWIITHKTTILWKGVGLAPGNAEDIYSGRAEAFGLLAGLLFIQHYIESYEPRQFNDSPLTCFCDNVGVITNVSELMTALRT